LEEALRSHWRPAEIICTQAGQTRHRELLDSAQCQATIVSPKTFQSISATNTSQGIICLLEPRAWTWADLQKTPALIVACDVLQDPGNAGTIARSAEAFGASGLVFLQGSVRVSNSKLLRASAGSLFRLPFLQDVDPRELQSKAQNASCAIWALDARGDASIWDLDWQQDCLIIIGNEGNGVSPELLSISQSVSIPTVGVESLNAGVACSILLYEVWRQRSAR
jgi:RNA methyltransferase, TrmH family